MRKGFRNLSPYGFLQGAWPFGVVDAIWAGVASHVVGEKQYEDGGRRCGLIAG